MTSTPPGSRHETPLSVFIRVGTVYREHKINLVVCHVFVWSSVAQATVVHGSPPLGPSPPTLVPSMLRRLVLVNSSRD